MTDMEKVTKGLRQHCEGSMFDRCGECPYYEIDHEPFICRDMLLNDLNVLLKEQEARWISVPHKRARICSHCEADEPYKFADDDAEVYEYCPHCGAKMTECR